MAMAPPPPRAEPPVAPPPSSGRGYTARPAEPLLDPFPPTKLRWWIGKAILWFIDGAKRREAVNVERLREGVADREARLRRWEER